MSSGADERRWPPQDQAARECFHALAAYLGVDPDGTVAPFQALELASDAVVLVDAGRRILYCNARAAELTGYSREQMLGLSCADGLHSVDCGSHCPLFDAGTICQKHCQLVTRSGAPLHVVKNARVLRGPDGRIVGGIESMHDVSDLRQTEESLRTQARELTAECGLLEGFVRGVEEGVIAVDAQARVRCLSARAAELLGVDPATRHVPVLDLVRDDGQLAAALGEVLRAGGRREIADLDVRRRRGTRVTLRVIGVATAHGQVLGATLVVLNASVADATAFYDMIGDAPAMRRLRGQITSAAQSDATVLISGESGVGKELVARALHLAGSRRERPFHAVNCAGLTEPLLESELFGHEKGAFTGADHAKPGRLELVGDGTLLFDEIGCLTPRLQAKLLRVLEQREFERVGGTRTLHLRARVLAATNADLEEAVAAGAFRPDLFYRLRVVPLEVPPLRQRREDVLDLARHFVTRLRDGGAAGAAGAPVLTASAEAALVRYGWPGNVRELRNAMQYAVTLGRGQPVGLYDLPPEIRRCAGDRDGDGDERQRIAAALVEARYHRALAAERLCMSRTTLWRKMRQHGLTGA